MYQIKCDDYILYDPRDEELILLNPRFNLAVNTAGGGSFTIFNNHPNYGKLKKLKSIFELSDEYGVIFRGRMTDETKDFNNSKAIELEGAMAFFNDSQVKPFTFPDDFEGDDGYTTAATNGNVVKFFLGWLIDGHNAQVQPFQRLKLGNVTVTDPNNYLSRSSTAYASTWETLKSKLFESALGGYLCIRYEADGNYIDYLAGFDLTNTQEIVFGENMLDLIDSTTTNQTYSAIIPIGATVETNTQTEDGSTLKYTVKITDLPDGDVTSDIVKQGDTLYSKSALEEYGWICAPTSETTWGDVTEPRNLLTKGTEWLSGKGIMLSNTIEVTAIDLHCTDSAIRSFRLYRNIRAKSVPHDLVKTYQLTALDLDIMNPQNTKIRGGETVLTLVDKNDKDKAETIERVESAEKEIAGSKTDINETKEMILEQSTSIVNTCEGILLAALKAYVEKSTYESFKETVETEMSVMAGELNLKFTQALTEIENVNGDLQEKFNTITKYFTFDINGLTIGQVDNPYKVVLDNDRYSMQVNGVEVLWIDAITQEIHTPEITITNRLTIMGYLIEEDVAGNVNCEYVGN